MLRCERLLQKPRTFTRITGIKPEVFTKLVDKLDPLWKESERKRLSSKQRKRAIGGGRKYILDRIELKLLLILMFYRHNVTHEFLGFMFDVNQSSATRLLGRLSSVFEQAADPELKVRFKEEKEASEEIKSEIDFFRKYPELKEICVDATEQKIQRSKNKEIRKNNYSGKKKSFTRKTQIIISSSSRILDVSKTYPGSVHDKKMFDIENTIDKIPLQSGLLGDLGYLGVSNDHPEYKVILPYKKKKGQAKLEPEQALFNKKHSSRRVAVEHVFARIKKFRICYEIYRGKGKKYNQMFRNIAALVNLSYCTT